MTIRDFQTFFENYSPDTEIVLSKNYGEEMFEIVGIGNGINSKSIQICFNENLKDYHDRMRKKIDMDIILHSK